MGFAAAARRAFEPWRAEKPRQVTRLRQTIFRRAAGTWLLPPSLLKCRHDPLSQELDRPQHFGLFHARPLDPEDKAVDPESINVASQLADAVVGITDDEASLHQFLERHVEAIPLRQGFVLSP